MGFHAGLFRQGVELFNRQEYFECHEVWEQLWTPSRPPERLFLQSLIHFAVGLYHHRNQNALGASRQLAKGLRKIEAYLPEWGGVRTAALAEDMSRCLRTIESGGTVTHFPVISETAVSS